MFKPVPTRVDYVQLEHEVQDWWDANQTLAKYLQRNQDATKRWSFIDGPITANNPMGVHHAWGRSYKDLYNRFKTMQGFKLRYQQGFDCQGLWIEVEVEKELGFTNKHDIERFGVAEFVEACKARVERFANQITQQSLRLAYWMDWDNSYYTNSDENNYTIWLFLKKCWQNGWLYKGHDTMPWCPRCGTGISQHEIVTEGYKEITHQSVYLKFPLTDGQTSSQADGQSSNPAIGQNAPSRHPEPVEGRGGGDGEAPSAEAAGFIPQTSSSAEASPPTSNLQPPTSNESLLVWTTTPWTLAANVAAAVHPDLTYLKVKQGDDILYVSQGALATAVRGEHEVIGEVKGSELIGLTYLGPFDELPAQQSVVHRVIAWDEVSDEEGTGIVHIAPGAGAEDFALSKVYDLAVIAPLEEDGTYTRGAGFGFLEGRFAGDVAADVFASLREKGLLYRVQNYTHRYPTCWRCGSELVFRLVDEWFISMEELRFKTMDVTQRARWIPEFGLAREMDWLKNMHDWMISKKRYYGLALPIYECQDCGNFEVMGSEVELQERAVAGWDDFKGHSPHRPWIDAVKIACASCGAPVERIKEVGNPWLDAGIVPYSTLNYRHDRAYWEQWFPADWVSESFPGQFRNWFYSMLAMSAALEEREPFKTLFGYALLRDEKGEEMHKSKGNAIWFEDAAERMGADVMRWMFFRHPPANNLNFGWGVADEIKRNFLSTLWNTYSFFTTYANIDKWTPAIGQSGNRANGQAAAPPLGTPSQHPEPVEGRGGGGAEASAHPEALEGEGDAGSRPDGEAAGFIPQTASSPPTSNLSELDRWALSELNQLVATVTDALENYDAMAAARQIEDFVEGLSNWYVRRSRRRFWKSESDADKQAAYETLYTCLATLNRLMAPMTPFLAEDVYQNLVRSWDPSAPESVHLTDFPVADIALIDEELADEVRLAQFVTALGHAARNKSQKKVRQPLSEIILVGFSTPQQDAIRRQSDVISDELNVKSIRFDSDLQRTQYLEWWPAVNRDKANSLRERFGNEGLREINLVAQDKETLKRLLSTQIGTRLSVAGLELERGDFMAQFSPVPPYVTVGMPMILDWHDSKTLTLNTEVTPELADEGLARELVRRIQEMRKSAGFEIADRIRLSYEGDAGLDRVIRDWAGYIRQETLAEAINSARPEALEGRTSGGYTEDHDIDGRKVKLAVEKL